MRLTILWYRSRMATEIRLDYRLSEASLTATASSASQPCASEIDREKTWMLLCVSDISLALSTGRSRGLYTTQFSSILRRSRSEIPQEVQCLFTLRVLVAHGMDRITTLLASGKCKVADREDFLKRWKADVASITSPHPPDGRSDSPRRDLA